MSLAQRLVDLGVLLGDQEDSLLRCRQGLLEGPHGALPPDDERRHHVGEDHHVPQGDEGQGLAGLGYERGMHFGQAF